MRPSVLVVEDEKLTREGIAATLRNWGCERVTLASNGRDALFLLKEKGAESFDFLITDMRMPIMDGPEMLAELARKGVTIPTIVLSAHADFSYAQQAIRYGVFEYILKPVDPAQLVQALERQLARGSGAKSGQIDLPEVLKSSEFFEKTRSVWNVNIKAALEYLMQHYQSDPGVREVAGAVGLNPTYFCSLFKTETGYTFSECLMEIRIWQAKKLLVTTDMRVYEIADAAGYSTARYFAKTFHEKTGVTPVEFRNRFRT